MNIKKSKEEHEPKNSHKERCKICSQFDCICKPMTDEVKYGNREVSKK
jgi:hypothetical protein